VDAPATSALSRARALRRGRALNWTRLSDEQLLRLRLCDLRLDLVRSPLQRHVERLYAELGERGIRFRPHVWLSGDWFSPDGVPGIAVPFYLAHPRLRRLARKMTREIEGSNANWLQRILRHEAGHAIDSAFRLRRRAHWRALFGPASLPYRSRYRVRPGSRHYVQHLGDWYAQSHPTEDFAETFAVWLAPRSDWQRRYASWPALRKLRFVQRLARELRAHRPPVRCRTCIEPLNRQQRTLAQFFRSKRNQSPAAVHNLADRLLTRVFGEQAAARARSAAALLRAHKARLISQAIGDTGAERYLVHQIMRKLIERCVDRGLCVRGGRREALAATRPMLRQLVRRYLRSQGLRLRA
jgi:hypothetical protein